MSTLKIVFLLSGEEELNFLQKNPTYQEAKDQVLFFLLPEKIFDPEILPEIAGKIFQNISEELILFLQSEECFENVLKIPRDYRYSKALIVTKKDKNPLNKLFHLEKRLFSRNKTLLENSFSDYEFVIEKNETLFPDLKKIRLKNLSRAYQNNSRKLFLINELIDYGQIKPSPNLLSSLADYRYQQKDLLKLYCSIAQKLIVENNFLTAKNILFEALNLFPDSPDLNYMLGDLFSRLKKYPRAINFFTVCLDLQKEYRLSFMIPSPHDLIIYLSFYSLAMINLELDELILARDYFESAFDLFPGTNEVNQGLKQVEEKLQKKDNFHQDTDFVCNSCGNCCRMFDVEITLSDLKRILQNRQDLSWQDVIEFRVAAFQKKLPEQKQKKSLMLKKQNGSKDCIFLANNRCQIHDFKPFVCQVWPFTLRKSGNLLWDSKQRPFIKNYCAHSLVKGAVDQPLLKEKLKESFKNARQSKEELKSLQGSCSLEEIEQFFRELSPPQN